jgi:hypothetical protein
VLNLKRWIFGLWCWFGRVDIGISAKRSITLASSAGVGMVKRAPFMWVACAVSASAMLRKNGKTCSETISNILAGSLFFSRDQRISS